MLKLKIKFLVLLLVFLVTLPQVSSAYFTTAQSAVQLNAETLLYTISYKFGFQDRELRMPIGAVRDLQFGDASPYVGYTLLKDSETAVNTGTTSALVLSDANVVDNQYYLPAGKSATFTLVTLVKLGVGFVPAESKDYDLSLRVTSLPFTMIIKEKGVKTEILGKLNPSELQYYTTPELDLK